MRDSCKEINLQIHHETNAVAVKTKIWIRVMTLHVENYTFIAYNI